MVHSRRVHDRSILDALESMEPEPIEGDVWRVARKGRDPFRGSLEPVWPSRLEHEIHRIDAQSPRTLHIADVTALGALGVEVARYESLDYLATQAIAAAAHFLEFESDAVPGDCQKVCAWSCNAPSRWIRKLGAEV